MIFATIQVLISLFGVVLAIVFSPFIMLLAAIHDQAEKNDMEKLKQKYRRNNERS